MEREINTHRLINKIFHLSVVASSAFIYSVIIHILLLLALLTITPKIEAPQKQIIKIISAKLFYKNKPKPTPVQQVKESSVQKNEVETKEKPEEKLNENKAKREIRYAKKNQVVEKENISPEAPKQNFSSLNSLQSLREKISQQSYNQSANDHYQASVERKNFIPRSATKFKQLAEAKPVTIKVDCDNTFNKGMMIMSGLLGGGIKCNSFNGSQRFIDKRLEKLGKKAGNKKPTKVGFK